jgi:hypothetical protein
MNNKGRAYAFFNCRRPKAEVVWISDDIRRFFAQSIPILEHLALKVNQGTSTMKKNQWRGTEDKGKLIALARDAEKEGGLSLKPGAIPIRRGQETVAHDFGNLFTIRATLPEATNHDTADELAPILNQMYNSPLFEEGEPFRGIIAYFDNGRYILRK